MYSVQEFVFFEAATAAGSESVELPHDVSELSLAISGDASSFSVSAQGSADGENYSDLGILSLQNLSVVSAITSKGFFLIPIDGINFLKIEIESVSGGNLDITGKAGK